MKKQSRRKFVASAVALGTSAVATGMPTMESKDKKQLVHHVFFWLKNPDSKEDLAKLLASEEAGAIELPLGDPRVAPFLISQRGPTGADRTE